MFQAGKDSLASQFSKVSFESLPFRYGFDTVFHFEEDLAAPGPGQTDETAGGEFGGDAEGGFGFHQVEAAS